jgi:hypothetical protein
MMSGLSRATIVMLLIPQLIDLAVKYGIPGQSKISLSLTKNKAARHGLFYNLPEHEAISIPSHVIDGSIINRRNPAMEQRLMETRAAKQQLALLTDAVRNGRKRNWALEAAALTALVKPAHKEPVAVLTHSIRCHAAVKDKTVKSPVITLETAPYRRPWFRDAEISAGYRERAPVMSAVITGAHIRSDKPARRGGLFYNGDEWSRYREQSLQAVIKEKKNFKAVERPQRVFIESSYPWRNTY